LDPENETGRFSWKRMPFRRGRSGCAAFDALDAEIARQDRLPSREQGGPDAELTAYPSAEGRLAE
jgi:hypothetical protein